MKNFMKSELTANILTGLMLAATFGAVMPADTFAAGPLSTTVDQAASYVGGPVLEAVTLISYALGAVLVVAGIAGAKKHADSPGQNPLGPALGKMGAGAAFLAAPGVVGILAGTGTSVFGTSSAAYSPNGMGLGSGGQ